MTVKWHDLRAYDPWPERTFNQDLEPQPLFAWERLRLDPDDVDYLAQERRN